MNGMSDVRLTLHGQELEAGQARAMSAMTSASCCLRKARPRSTW